LHLSVCTNSVYKHTAPTFSDRHKSSTIDLLFCSTGYEPGRRVDGRLPYSAF
jgi:hypothetical protein